MCKNHPNPPSLCSRPSAPYALTAKRTWCSCAAMERAKCAVTKLSAVPFAGDPSKNASSSFKCSSHLLPLHHPLHFTHISLYTHIFSIHIICVHSIVLNPTHPEILLPNDDIRAIERSTHTTHMFKVSYRGQLLLRFSTPPSTPQCFITLSIQYLFFKFCIILMIYRTNLCLPDIVYTFVYILYILNCAVIFHIYYCLYIAMHRD